jgi:hypothetical protein
MIPSSSETSICNTDHINKATPLLRRVQDHCDYGFSVGRYPTQLGCHGTYIKVGSGTGALSIDFKPRTAIKSQALVDFISECRENQMPTPVDKPEHRTMYFDGSLKLDGGGAGVLFISPKGEQLKYVLQILWEVSNNEAEYEALLHGLRLAISLGIK